MSRSLKPPLAEMADRRWELLALAVFLMALKYSASAAMAVVEGPWVRYLDWFAAATALSTVAIILWMMSIKLRVASRQRQRFLKLEGYVAEAIKNAIKRSWGATFVLLVILTEIAEKSFANLIPTGFYLQLTVAVMLGVFSVSFFIINRPSDDNEEV